MKTLFHRCRSFIGLRVMAGSLALVAGVQAQTPPDLTTAGAIAALKADTNANPSYNETYNLGPTGLRGWIYVGGGNGADGTFTDASRQILVTVASAPANSVLAVDDVILGAMAASSGTVPLFSTDCRKAFGAAITDAEKTGAGTLRVKRWRAGTTTDVNIPMTIMGNYTATAPYSCPKSTAILTNARNKLVGQLLADANFFNNGQRYSRPIHGLALLAGVAPGDPDYAAVQTRLQTYARATATAGPQQGGIPTWDWAYSCLFLAEYYLSTNDANVLPGIATFTNQLVQSQSIYGTFGHGPAALHPDGSGRLISTGYGPVNSVAIVANMAIFMGKKALVAGGQTIDPGIDPALQRASDFFAWYVNKGTIPYGEHAPWMGNHESNGKDPMSAVFFGLQPDRTAETEYFTRMSIAGFNSRESGHTGQGFSYLWGAMGANVGGAEATAEYLKNVRWHLDLTRRTDGSFSYDGREGWGPGSTADGTYLGASGYNDLNPTASYILTFALPLQRLYITGKNANPANTLDTTKVAHAVSSATFKQQSPSKTNSELITALSDFDPIVRNYAAIELGKRSPSAGELTTLRGMVTSTDANSRMGACQALGLLKDSAALSLINDRLDKTIESNSWVRAQAANAIRQYPSATISPNRDALLSRFTANATDPDNIDWDDPLQAANNFLSLLVFGNGVPDGTGGNDIVSYTINAPKNLLYPAISAGLKQPDSYPRTGVAQFCYDRLPLVDVQALVPDLFKLAQSEGLADRMWGAPARALGISTLAKYKIRETIPVALSMLEVPAGFTWDAYNYINPALNAMGSYGDASRWTLPTLNNYRNTWSPQDYSYPAQAYPTLVSTIATIENAITAPAQNLGLAVANSQVVSTTGAQAITLTGTSPRGAVTFANVTAPAHGTLTGTAPNLTYTPNSGHTGPDHFTFQVIDSLGAANPSAPGTVSLIVGTAGSGLKGEYFNNADFTSLQLTRTDAQVNFDWGTGSPHASIGADTFSVRWSGVLLVPETGSYTFSTLNSDGVRLYINGVPAINQFADQSTNWNDSTPITLTEGQLVDIQMDYYENTGSAVAKLKWTGPSFAGDNGAIIGSQWLFDGSGMNRAPYAFVQSLTVLKNTSKAITLAGSAGSLTYTLVTQPAHGTLTGTAPNLTYTPTANYIGPDSFTFKVNNGTTDSAPATVSIDVIPANTFSVNFHANGGLTTPEAQANLQLNPGMSAGLADWLTYGWTNIEVPWAPSAPQAPATLTSNQGSTATFVFKDCRNGGPYNWSVPRTTLLGDGNGNLMDGHVNSTLDPGDGTNLFDMEITGIPFAVYDVIFYMGANKDQYGDGTGVIKFNGGADRAFKLKPGAFDGSFTEMVNASTPGNYLVFSGVTGSSFTAQTWGTGSGGFNHIGPCGFQIREAVVADTTPPTLNGSSIVDDKSGAPVNTNTVVNYTVTFSEDMDAGTVSATDFGNAGTSAITIGTVSETSPGVFTVPVTPTSAGTLQLRVNAGAVLNDAAGNALVTTSAIADDTTLSVTTNTAPVANSQNVSTVENTAKPITLTATDAEGNPLTYTIVNQPAHGSLSGTAPSVIYTPSSNYTGADSFTFKVNDGTLDSATATVSITVSPVSQPTWGAATAISAASDIQSTGVSNLAGANFGITTGTTTIVPAAETGTVDVEFKSLRSGQNVTLSNGINVAADSDWGNWGLAAGNSVVAGNFGTVLDSNLGIETGAPVSPSATITLSGLNIGTQYQIQFFADSTGSNTQTISGGGPINSLNGQSITGTFTADATTRVLTVTRNTDFAVANALTIGTLDPLPPSLAFSSLTTMTQNATAFNLSVFDGNAKYQPNADTGDNTTRILGDGTLLDWNLLGGSNLNNQVFNDHSAGYANGPAPYINNPSSTQPDGTTPALIYTPNNWAQVWTTTDPGADFSSSADQTTYTVLNAGANAAPMGPLTGTVNISTLTSGQFYIFAGGYQANTDYVVSLSGPGQPTLNASANDAINVNQNRVNCVLFEFTNPGGLYDTLTWTYTHNSTSTRGRFMGVALDGVASADITPPTLAGSSIVDDKSGGPVTPDTLVVYTVSFSEDMDATTVSAADFGNAGTSAVAIGTVSETSPGVFSVPVTPTSAGTLQLKVNAGAVLLDLAGNALNTNSAIADDTVLNVVQPNTAPVADAQGVSTPEDTAKEITLTAADAEGNPLTYIIVTQPANGTLGGTAPNVTYTPAANYNGADSFTFKANDGLLDSAIATVSITVTAVNDAPVATAQSVSTAEDTAKAITLGGTDAEGGALTYIIVTQPANGTLGGTAPNVTYTPAANYGGADSFTFKVNDGTVDSATATVSITVTPVNDVPVATPQSLVVSSLFGGTAAITLAGSDVEGSALTYTVVTQPTNGSLSGTAPNLTYTAGAGYSGPDSFTFKVNDGTEDSAPATVTLTVSLPLPWIDAEIGTGMLAGSVTTSAGTFTQAGSGIIGSTSDKCNFLYQTLTGDGEIKVRISNLQNTGTSSRVGVMIRDTLAANSKRIFMGMSDTGTYRWVRRTSTGGNSSVTASSTGTVPNTWVRLVRSGTTITAYKSANGTSWTKVGDTKNTTFASTCYIGLAVGSGSNTTLNTSQFNNVSVTP